MWRVCGVSDVVCVYRCACAIAARHLYFTLRGGASSERYDIVTTPRIKLNLKVCTRVGVP
jgi:hypothetical protein